MSRLGDRFDLYRWARQALGLLYVRTGKRKDALPLFERASALAPNNPQYALVYAVALVESGERAKGIKVLESAAQRFPDNSAVRQALEAYRSQ